MTHHLHLGDCLDGLGDLPSGSVDLTVTSPPYSALRTFGGNTLDQDSFEAVAGELWRVTREGGVVCWQEGDTMARGSWTDLPYRHLLHFRDLGFAHYDTVYCGCLGGRTKDRHYSNPPQCVWVLSRGRPTTVNLQQQRNHTAGTVGGGTCFRYADGSRKPRVKGVVAPDGVRDVWWYYHPCDHCEQPYRDLLHGGVMHNLVARDLIRSYSRRFDLVIDPFAGLCTTGKWAALEGRQFAGWEIHEPYWRWGCRRLEAAVTERIRML